MKQSVPWAISYAILGAIIGISVTVGLSGLKDVVNFRTPADFAGSLDISLGPRQWKLTDSTKKFFVVGQFQGTLVQREMWVFNYSPLDTFPSDTAKLEQAVLPNRPTPPPTPPAGIPAPAQGGKKP